MSGTPMNGTAGAGEPLALVCGFAVHGLAVARALARRGVEVHALADRERFRGPTTFTRYAQVHVRDGLNTDRLLAHLEEFAAKHAGRPIVLFPTSDRMAGTVARHWSRLEGRYVLSWAHCRDLVLKLQSKDSLAEFAARAGVRYPRSRVLAGADEAAGILADLRAPLIIKPVRPLSSFKAINVAGEQELAELARRFPADLPFLCQEYIAGGDGTLHACTFYLDHGREICALASRKLAAAPPGLGQGTVFVTEDNPRTLAIARGLLAGVDLSGPVAVEFKRDEAGEFWLIEPNVGRTEYCVDLAIQAGVNLPYVEYCCALGLPVPADCSGAPGPRAWFDTDKDPLCYLRSGDLARSTLPGMKPVFPFLGHGDPGPVMASALAQAIDALRTGAGRLLGR